MSLQWNLEDTVFARLKTKWENENKPGTCEDAASNGVVLLTKYNVSNPIWYMLVNRVVQVFFPQVGQLLENQANILRAIHSIRDRQSVLSQDIFALKTALNQKSIPPSNLGQYGANAELVGLPPVFTVKIRMDNVVLPKMLTARLEGATVDNPNHSTHLQQKESAPSNEEMGDGSFQVNNSAALKPRDSQSEDSNPMYTALATSQASSTISQQFPTQPKDGGSGARDNAKPRNYEVSSQPSRTQRKSDYLPLEEPYNIFIDDSAGKKCQKAVQKT